MFMHVYVCNHIILIYNVLMILSIVKYTIRTIKMKDVLHIRKNVITF